ncbi:MAG: hypothetical protein R6W83_01140 [Cryobacterium sp.]
MKRRLVVIVAVPLLLGLAGCGQAQESAQDAAGDAAATAAAAAAARVQEQVCSVVADGQISEQDRQTLSGLLVAAEAAGVPAEFVTPLEDIAQAGDQLPSDALEKLNRACGSEETTPPTS